MIFLEDWEIDGCGRARERYSLYDIMEEEKEKTDEKKNLRKIKQNL